MTTIANRYEFVYLFDVTNGNPNGDPDAGNLPRLDPETGNGLVTDVCLKRKVRNFVELATNGESRFGIYVQEGSILNEKHREAYLRVRDGDKDVAKAKKLSPKGEEEAKAVRQFMCDNFYDVRTFGAVMSTGINCGQVRGPVQIAFGHSVEPILPMEISITRMAATNESEKKQREEGADDDRQDNRTMGRKHIVPYGLYRAHGYVNANLAGKTGFSDEDLGFFWSALENMFEHDRSAARGEMSARALITFRHADALGKAHAHKLFDAVEVKRAFQGDEYDLPLTDGANIPPARRFEDYRVILHRDRIPEGVDVTERL